MTATEQIMALLERWDRQQEGYIRQREERYEAMFQLLEDLFGRDGRFTAIDAACGPGPRPAPARTLPGGAGGGAGRRRHAAGDRAYGAGRFRRAGPRGGVRPHRSRLDRTGRRSARVLAGERPAALLSSTALHWLSPAELAGFYAQAGELLAPGGVLLNTDHMRYDRRWPGLAELSRKHRERVLQASVASGADSWEDWWQRAAQIPGWPR